MTDEDRPNSVSAVPRRSRLRLWFSRAAIAAIYAYVTAVLVSRLNVSIELLAHFVVHALVGTSILFLLLLRIGSTKEKIACAIPLLYLLFLTEPWAVWLPIPLQPKLSADRSETVRVLSWNILYTNRNDDEMRSVVESRETDILILIEVSPSLLEGRQWLRTDKPFGTEKPAWRGAGIAVFTRREDITLETKFFYDENLPSIVIDIPASDGSRHMKLVAMHTASPMPPSRAIPRDLQLAAFRQWAQEQDCPVCLIGDLNTTPWTQGYKELEAAGFFDS
ncbi:MAG: hypothetical protein U0892_18695 [Pirellulales bacterium]